jgi:cold shock CspA family protein
MQKATVRWFDNASQEGMIRLADGSSVYVNNDPCHGYLLNGGSFNGLFQESAKGKAYDLKSGQAVLVEVYEDTTFRQVSKLVVVQS